jgi:hypothetical protein
MTKGLGRGHAWALATVVAGAVMVMTDPGASASVADLMGSGPGRMGLLWGCGVCVGAGAMVIAGGLPAILTYLATASKLGAISVCVGLCYGAFTV